MCREDRNSTDVRLTNICSLPFPRTGWPRCRRDRCDCSSSSFPAERRTSKTTRSRRTRSWNADRARFRRHPSTSPRISLSSTAATVVSSRGSMGSGSPMDLPILCRCLRILALRRCLAPYTGLGKDSLLDFQAVLLRSYIDRPKKRTGLFVI